MSYFGLLVFVIIVFQLLSRWQLAHIAHARVIGLTKMRSKGACSVKTGVTETFNNTVLPRISLE